MPKINNSGFNTHEYKYYLMILVKQQCTCLVGMVNNLVKTKILLSLSLMIDSQNLKIIFYIGQARNRLYKRMQNNLLY